ncbi:hypothetical protein NC653_029525 [Populus alba x Populus x berolinensis]|uniref:Uncharacterized protein n=1 Tax=Populus alba x Populus x berolinensis TaxID=444605 RepID=A0AAD6Q5B9_9ROSI|nr:hypothetical protein NC653_029525 [Populus alba x Populus x berolinensis]
MEPLLSIVLCQFISLARTSWFFLLALFLFSVIDMGHGLPYHLVPFLKFSSLDEHLILC